MQELMQLIKDLDVEKLHQELINDPALVDGETFFYACEQGDLEAVRYLTEYSRISLNEKDEHYRGALHYAARSGSVPVFAYLVEKCCMDPLEGDRELITPWDEAEKAGAKEILAYLEKHLGAKKEDFYRNPIRTGMFPDPSVIRVGEDYYMVNSSFVYFPCIPVSHSRDLIHWEIIGYAVTDPKWAGLDDLEGGRGYWAPDISYFDGQFHITVTYRRNDVHPNREAGPLPSGLRKAESYHADVDKEIVYRRQMIVTSTRPEGPYSQPVWIDEDGIDPCLFHDEDGRNYMLLNRGARILELDKDCTKQISQAEMLCYGDNKRAPEGPHLFRKDGYYYLILAEGGTGPGHRVSIFRSRTLKGNYEPCPWNPIMRQWDENAPIQRCGHGELVDTPDGRWYMVYLCGRKVEDYTILGRETALDPVEWTAEGWPVVNRGKGPSCFQRKPYPEITHVTNLKNMNVFGLPTEFVSPRPWEEGAVSYEGAADGSGTWRIRGSREPFSRVGARNMMFCRQKAFRETVEVTVEISQAFKELSSEALQGSGPWEGNSMEQIPMAGLMGYYDENSFVFFGAIPREGKIELLLWEHAGKVDFQKTFAVGDETQYTLVMESDGLKRGFYTRKGREKTLLHTLERVTCLSDEGVRMGKRFTGAMAGMGVYSGNTPVTVTFKDFRRKDLTE
ncbi:MAG: family 43 glycosylhydrolase [Lachnospiraceae bacterium]|nr:family 43 glycosylhydrolase [Lachnospiraceae bacterium]